MNYHSRKQLPEAQKKRSPERTSTDLLRKSSLTIAPKHSANAKKVQFSESPYSRLSASQMRTKGSNSKSRDLSRESPTCGAQMLADEKSPKGLRLHRNPSYTDIYTDSLPRTPSPNVLGKSAGNDKATDSVLSLNKTLTDRLRALGPHYDIKDRYMVFQDMFASVVNLDTEFGLVLRRIKNGYEEVVTQYLHSDFDREFTKLSKQIQEMQDIFDQQQHEKETLLTTIAQLKKENVSINTLLLEHLSTEKALEKQLNEATAAQEKPSEPGENNGLNEVVKNLQEEVQVLKTREKLVLSVMKVAKQQGLPIDKIGEICNRHRKTQSVIPNSKVLVPRLNLPSMDLLSPIRKGSETFLWSDDASRPDLSEPTMTFCKEIDASRPSQGKESK